ncbi:hypothetical protein TcWFU_000735 [Taenia crassiceps]|uniref:Uncharacterized protein n=1 Tax=Taenia crassiceps TaxID=6207 RepID=A0ABR4Q685_9CEST
MGFNISFLQPAPLFHRAKTYSSARGSVMTVVIQLRCTSFLDEERLRLSLSNVVSLPVRRQDFGLFF